MIFKDKVTVVTGASQGIGETIARDFAAEGAVVVLEHVGIDGLFKERAGVLKWAQRRCCDRDADLFGTPRSCRIVEIEFPVAGSMVEYIGCP